jgi:hypothetical protein
MPLALLMFQEDLMNWMKRAFWWTAFLAVSSLALMACGKKRSDNNNGIVINGNATSDGVTVTAVSNVGGQVMSLSISNIQRLGTGSSNWGGWGGNQSMPSISATMIINGMPQNLNMQAGYMGQMQDQAFNTGFVQVWYRAICADSICDNVAVVVAIQNNVETLQLGVLHLGSQNRIRAVDERRRSDPSRPPVQFDQMAASLIQIAGSN